MVSGWIGGIGFEADEYWKVARTRATVGRQVGSLCFGGWEIIRLRTRASWPVSLK